MLFFSSGKLLSIRSGTVTFHICVPPLGAVFAVEALVSLGYSSKDAIKAVKKVDDIDKKNSEAILKEALKSLATL